MSNFSYKVARRIRRRSKKNFRKGATFLRIFYRYYYTLYKFLFGNGSFFDLEHAHEKNKPTRVEITDPTIHSGIVSGLLGWSDLPTIFYHRYQFYVKNKKKQFFDWYDSFTKNKKKTAKILSFIANQSCKVYNLIIPYLLKPIKICYNLISNLVKNNIVFKTIVFIVKRINRNIIDTKFNYGIDLDEEDDYEDMLIYRKKNANIIFLSIRGYYHSYIRRRYVSRKVRDYLVFRSEIKYYWLMFIHNTGLTRSFLNFFIGHTFNRKIARSAFASFMILRLKDYPIGEPIFYLIFGKDAFKEYPHIIEELYYFSCEIARLYTSILYYTLLYLTKTEPWKRDYKRIRLFFIRLKYKLFFFYDIIKTKTIYTVLYIKVKCKRIKWRLVVSQFIFVSIRAGYSAYLLIWLIHDHRAEFWAMIYHYSVELDDTAMMDIWYVFVNALVLAEWCETDYIWYIYADKMEFDLFMTSFSLWFVFLTVTFKQRNVGKKEHRNRIISRMFFSGLWKNLKRLFWIIGLLYIPGSLPRFFRFKANLLKMYHKIFHFLDINLDKIFYNLTIIINFIVKEILLFIKTTIIIIFFVMIRIPLFFIFIPFKYMFFPYMYPLILKILKVLLNILSKLVITLTPYIFLIVQCIFYYGLGIILSFIFNKLLMPLTLKFLNYFNTVESDLDRLKNKHRSEDGYSFTFAKDSDKITAFFNPGKKSWIYYVDLEIPYDKNKKIVWQFKMTAAEKATFDEEVRKKQEQKDLDWFEDQEQKFLRKNKKI